MADCIFCQIADGQVPAKFVYENENLVVFPDLNPKAPVHYLIVPKKHLPALETFKDEDLFLAGEIFKAVKILKEKIKAAESGYRLVVNSGPDSGQAVDHLHFHFLAGRKMAWPPG